MGAASAGWVERVTERFRSNKPAGKRCLCDGASLLVLLFFLNGCAGVVTGPGGSTQPVSLQLNPSAVSFGKVGLGKQSTQNFSITNFSNSTVTITKVNVSNSQFTLSPMALPLSLPSGQATNASVSVKPTAMGSMSGTVSIVDDATSTPFVMNLSATGVNPVAQISPSSSSVDLGSVTVGTQGTGSLTITNSGGADLTISMLSLTGAEFGVSGMTTPKTISSGQTATLTLAFLPTTAGAVSGSLAITSNDPANPTLSIALTGTGTSTQLGQLTANPTGIAFGNVNSGSSASKKIVLTNSGNAAVKISQISSSGSGFSVSGLTIPATVNALQSVTLTVGFAPVTAASTSGTITVTSDAKGSPLTLTLSGTGIATTQALSLSTASLNFGNVNTGGTSSESVVITNTGNSSVQISQITASGAGYGVSGGGTPLTLTPGQTLTLAISFSPSTPGSASGSVAVTSNATGSPLTIALTGTGVQAGLTVSPATFNFGSVVDGQTKSQTFSVTNTGSSSLTIAQLAVSGAGYSVSGLATPATLAAGQNASFSAEFAPTTAGSLAGTVSISSNAPNSPANVSLSGTGVAASVTLSASPTSLAFGSINAGSSSSKSVTVTNTGNATVTISQITVSAKDVNTSGMTTPLTLTPGQAMAMNVAFSPTTTETVTGNLTITSSQGSSSVIAISGNGVQAGLALTPATVNLGNVPVGSANSQTVQVSNTGTAVLTISQVSVAGSGFSSSGLSLPLSLNPGTSTTFNVQYQPAAAGTVSGSASIVSNAPSSPTVLALSGTGIASTRTLSFSTTSLNFGNVNTGGTSSQSVVVTNTGNSSVQISQVTASGAGYGISGAGTPVTLTPGQTLTLSISFNPSTAGTVNGSVTVTSNATGSPTTISLSGTGVQASHTVLLNWTASTSTVSGYNVYRSTTSGTGYARINASLATTLTYTDTTVQHGMTYYYVTTAVDSSGNESANSNEAQAIIP